MPDYAEIVSEMKSRYAVRVRRWRRNMTGCAWRVFYTDGTAINWIESPKPKTPISLAVFLHEIGHHAIGFEQYARGCEEEYHAWVWALDEMRRVGVEPDAKVLRRFDRSIRYAMEKDVRRGMTQFSEALQSFLPAA